MPFKVLGIGEVLWDLLPGGKQLGGAPANFAYHAFALGADASVVTRVGQDDYGREILKRFADLGLPRQTVQVDQQAPTGTVSVALDRQGVPQFTIHENVAWDRLALTPSALEAARRADAVCFGSLAQRNPAAGETIRQLVAACRDAASRVFDINLRQHYYSREVIEPSLRLANILKLNDSELPIVAELFGLAGSQPQQLERLAAMFDLQLVALTRGAHGSLLYQAGRWSEQPPKPVNVVDTVGAGDAFTAALVMGLLNRLDLDAVHAAAAELAHFVCSRAGATPVLPVEFRRRFSDRVVPRVG